MGLPVVEMEMWMKKDAMGSVEGVARVVSGGYHFFVRAVLPVVNERCESYQN